MAPSARAEHPLLQRLQEIRQRSETLIAGLEPDDLCLQGMADASPAKWHLGHTSWFFKEFLLGGDRKSTRLNSSHSQQSRMPSSA